MGEALQYPLTRTLTFHHDDEVIGIAGKTVAALFKLLIQWIKHHVGQERRNYAIDTKDNFEFERQIALCRSASLVDMRRKR